MPDARPTVEEALAIVRSASKPVGVTRLPLRQAIGRTLAGPVHAKLDVPRFVAAAMDGYAVSSTDCAAATADGPVALSIGKVGAAGRWPEALAVGTAAPISTGAPMPEGADAVIVREDGRIFGGCLSVTTPPPRFAHVRAIGEDMAAGRVIAPRGTGISADVIGALAAAGVDAVTVRRLPSILLFTTGDELADSALDLGNPAHIVDSNGPMIEAFLKSIGLVIDNVGRATDNLVALDTMLRRAVPKHTADIVISTGGVSRGNFDLVRKCLERAGATVHFHGVQMRPGKPLLFATLADGRLYFGLPGTPVAALVAMRFFVLPAIRALAGLPSEDGTVFSGGPPARPGTTLFLRARIIRNDEGELQVEIPTDQRSHVLSSLIPANAWLRVELAGSRVYPKTPAFLRHQD